MTKFILAAIFAVSSSFAVMADESSISECEMEKRGTFLSMLSAHGVSAQNLEKAVELLQKRHAEYRVKGFVLVVSQDAFFAKYTVDGKGYITAFGRQCTS